MKTAMITGITGQDGAYLSKLLSEKNYDVHGVVRRNSTNNMERLDKLDIKGKVSLHEGDLTEYESLWKIINEIRKNPVKPKGNTIKPLTGDLKKLWRYRTGNWRLVYQPILEYNKILFLYLKHRKEAYS